MPASALLLAVSSAARVASLNLCTDEYLLLLGRPQQIVGVSYLSRDPLESPLWKVARQYKGNRGSIEDVLALKPTLVLTMGGGGRATALLARQLHMQVIEMPYASNLSGVAKNVRSVAGALGNPAAAEPWLRRLEALRATTPRRAADTIWVSGGGLSLPTGTIGAEWMRLAGLEQRALPGGRATLETLLIHPPKVLVRSSYRSGQISGGQRWLEHPIVRRAGARQIATDGRPWTCMGPLMIPEIERLKEATGE